MQNKDTQIEATQLKLDHLRSIGLLSQDQALVVLREYKEKGENIEKIIVEFGFVSENALTEILSEDTGVRRIALSQTVLDTQLIQKLPRIIAEKFTVIPIAEKNNQLILHRKASQ